MGLERVLVVGGIETEVRAGAGVGTQVQAGAGGQE